MAIGRILVVGSVNLDILLFQDRLAVRGETYPARDVQEAFGGKGANQAVQCARLGVPVTFLGAVGRDARGSQCRDNLRAEGIECRLAEVDGPTGIGVVNVLPGGEVHATIVSGANSAVTSAWIRQNEDAFVGVDVVLLQNELSVEANTEALELARRSGAVVVYNAAPARPQDVALLCRCDYVIVNEEEALAYLGVDAGEDDMREAAARLTAYCPRVVVTLGSRGSLIAVGDEIRHVPAVAVTPVDTTGAGDSFVGALASALVAGAGEFEAATIASRVAAEATRGVGAQTAMTSSWGVEHDQVRAEAPDPRRA